MLDVISDNADFLIAAANTALDASLVPTMLNQRRDKASTVPLTTSISSTALWLFTTVVFASISPLDHDVRRNRDRGPLGDNRLATVRLRRPCLTQ